ncbi:glycoside hydrolase family 172 protein [Rubellicoccus peritrichatus]|uniref:Glycoside hydrolase family 172 protein n=1 Tax=Rubellicoccus peritrichatus TaxID=3080537 RepID=A0AAQ3LDU5_9BACT|nr:glycoside hydrolase family 172 protein [Puniceicoccus sp. CR14]WOO42757.1 glycoside hydrolase family 172 protein [Puniceicoccus sp. CR14]
MIFPLPYKTESLESHSISAGNPTGARSGVGTSQQNHNVPVAAGETVELANIEGPGMLRSFWLTFGNLFHAGAEKRPEMLRSYVLRIYWDGAEYPSVEAPLGDFFGLAHGRAAHYYSVYLAVNEGKGFNCFFPMPFSDHCRITLENDSLRDEKSFFYQINYTLGDEVGDDTARFHACFRREIPEPAAPFVMLDTRDVAGTYVGMNVSALPRSPGPWREGDFRFYIDGENNASIIGTGWSDWFQSAWGMGVHQNLYAGSNYQVPHPEFKDKYFCSSYRFHVADPIYFKTGLRLEHDTRGFEGYGDWVGEDLKYRQDDWSSTVYWYQHLTGKVQSEFPSREERIRDIELKDWEKELLAKLPLSRADAHRSFHLPDMLGDVPGQ